MLLEFALQKGGGEIIELAAPGNNCCALQSVVVTIDATFFLTKHDILQKRFHVVAILIDDIKVYLFGIGLERVLAPLALLRRVDIAIIKKAHDLEALGSKDLQRIYGTGGAAYVQ
jgi:hypothetical protein